MPRRWRSGGTRESCGTSTATRRSGGVLNAPDHCRRIRPGFGSRAWMGAAGRHDARTAKWQRRHVDRNKTMTQRARSTCSGAVTRGQVVVKFGQPSFPEGQSSGGRSRTAPVYHRASCPRLQTPCARNQAAVWQSRRRVSGRPHRRQIPDTTVRIIGRIRSRRPGRLAEQSGTAPARWISTAAACDRSRSIR